VGADAPPEFRFILDGCDRADFERLTPTPFSTVCFRAHPKGVDEESALAALNEQLLERVNATGRAFLSHTKLRDRFTIRWAIGNLRTDEARVEETWKILNDSLQEIRRSGN
jgi:aromatic-L-amino-acid decarboxylase